MASAESASNTRLFKFVFIGLNILFGILGLACFVVGVVVKFSIDPSTANASETNTIAYMLIFVGFFTLLTSVLGCLAGGYENICLLVLYFLIVFLTFVLLLAVGIYSFKKGSHEDVDNADDQKLMEAVASYYNDNSSTARNYTDLIQTQRKCCGARQGEKDYAGQPIPETCVPLDVITAAPPSGEHDRAAATVAAESANADAAAAATVAAEAGAGNGADAAATTTTASQAPASVASTPAPVYNPCIAPVSIVSGHFATAGGLALGFAVVALLCLVASLFLCAVIRNKKPETSPTL